MADTIKTIPAEADPTKPTLLHLASSTSTPCLWLLEELGVEYNLKLFPRPGGRAPPELKETHPQGKSPQFILPDGRLITQAAAILLYIINTYDTENRFHHPDDDPVREEQLVCMGIADMSSKVGAKLMFHGMAVKSPFFIRPIMVQVRNTINKLVLDDDVKNILVVLEKELEGKQYFMGHDTPTRADFILRFNVDLAVQSGYADLKDYPNLKAWTERCVAREGWKKAMEKTNAYNLDFPSQF